MASRKLIDHLEKHLFKSSVNPMWTNYMTKTGDHLDNHPQLVDEFIQLEIATLAYRKLLEDYNIGTKRDESAHRENVARHCGLLMPIKPKK